MDDFEAVAFAGLEEDQRTNLWVRHSHAGHHELHFVIPRVELSRPGLQSMPARLAKGFRCLSRPAQYPGRLGQTG